MKYRLFYALLTSIWFAGCTAGRDEQQNTETNASAVYYTCSMHPEVHAAEPGNCPICKMPLIAVVKTELGPNEIQLSLRQQELGNIRLDTVRVRRIVRELPLTGSLVANPARTRMVSARAMGRLDRLYVKTVGDRLVKGAPLFELYSDDLALAKRELYLAAEKKANLPPGGEAAVYERIYQAARKRLELWGLRERQLALVEQGKDQSPVTTFFSSEQGSVTELFVTEGAYVMEGSAVLQVTELSSLWVQAQVYGEELALVRPGMMARVDIPGYSGKPLRGNIAFVNPEFNPQTKITLVRVEIPNPGGVLRPGMLATVYLQPTDRVALALPTDAVLREANGNTVWIETAANTFSSRMVDLGMEQDGWVEVRSGLQGGERVVVTGAYLVNSEFVFKKGTGVMEGHGH